MNKIIELTCVKCDKPFEVDLADIRDAIHKGSRYQHNCKHCDKVHLLDLELTDIVTLDIYHCMKSVRV